MQHLDLKLLRSFAAVADERSVTRAAARLNLTQPTVSGQIKELEQILGYLLFHRTSRRIALSEQGKRLLPLVQTLLHNAEEVRQEAEALREAANRHFRLGAAMYTMDLPDRMALLDAFARARPETSYSIDNRLQTDSVRDLLTDRLDVALLLGVAVEEPVEKFIHDLPSGCVVNEIQYPAKLERVLLRRRKIGLLVPNDSDLAGYDVLPRSVLSGQRVAMLGGEHGQAVVDPIAQFIMEHGAIPVAVAEGNALAIERYARSNHCCAIGIGWFPTPDGMVWREVEDMPFHLDLAVVLGTNPNKAARRFFEFARTFQESREDGLAVAGPARCVTVQAPHGIGNSLH
ncbi:LysR family transcriptional regulator [Croceicoccus sp. BE223]|uniref:LysR family transcriptional regulator n=1 Tax=Croceicoccus sp. BE223 TaxID=2817716 RepID=UPI0028642F1C|nr:LysR family transcriptional regulator [Croceicoccus sp. BE223]MDR7104120.1 DNA-binding transcriptional LysR family regulator [Croceicoccus sp. BE223]